MRQDTAKSAPTLSQEDTTLLDAFRQRYPFPLDPFQEEAIRFIVEGSSVIVSAPTGAGKTLIAEFAIFRTLRQGRRIAYTTPLKALSNQKYADFCRQFGEGTVGILTGDVKVNPTASVLVMTTEILRNMFYVDPPRDLACVILDECHYMGDEGRGTVWEEIIINCPKDVQLVALSATVSNIGEIADWISEIHRPIKAIHHPVRPVPLQYLLCDREGRIFSLSELPKRRRHPPEERSRFLRRRLPDPNQLIQELKLRRWLPAIYFIFSRSGCEAALRRFLEEHVSLIEPHRRREVEEAIQRTLLDYPSIVPESDLNSLIFKGLQRGAGIHHAGILPALKRLTEVLFERGLVKVVFATETMSLGIHMPAKSVVIQNLRKRSEHGFRSLTVSELTQMAGRAGRRGIDPEGKCIVTLDSPEALEDALRVIRGRPEPIESQFRVGYSSAALLVASLHDPRAIRQTIERSFGQFQNVKRMQVLEAEREELLAKLAKAEGFASPCCDISELIQYQEKRALVEAERRKLRGSGRPRRRGKKGEPSSFPWDESLYEARARLEQLALGLSQMPCHRCPERGSNERRLKRSRRLREAVERRRQLLQQLQDTYWEQFLKVAKVLEHFGYIEDGVLLPEGRLIASLRHDNELLVARVLFSRVLEGLNAAEMAALLSCLIEEAREAETLFAKAFLKEHPHLRRRIRAMEALAEELERTQRAYQVALPLSMHTSYIAAAYRWASGEDDWLAIVQRSYGGHEGDLIRAFRRLIDLGRQLAEAPWLDSSSRRKLGEAVLRLDRGIVLESALI